MTSQESYILMPNGIVRFGALYIPADPANTDYQAYLAWVAEGNTAEEWNPQG